MSYSRVDISEDPRGRPPKPLCVDCKHYRGEEG